MTEIPTTKGLRLGEKYYRVAEAIRRLPRPARDWFEKAACREQEYGGGLDGTEEIVLRRQADQYFIGRFCAQCVVPRECFIEGVQLGETGAVRGGLPTLEVAKYSTAYLELTKSQLPPDNA